MKKVLLTSLFLFCRLFAQELLFEDGLYYEKPISSDDYNKYTSNNISYKQGCILVYDYYYMEKTGSKKKFIKTKKFSEQNPLHLVDYDNVGDSVIDRIKLQVDDEFLVNFNSDSTDTQTHINYSYLSKELSIFPHFPDEITGVIDNEKNIWIHPPRDYTFNILQLNPYPFYYTDESVKHWTWKLKVGGSYSLDSRWISAKDPLLINYDYVRCADETIATELGSLTCRVIKATAYSEFEGKMMRTALKSYYHPDHGFVKLVYDNINGSRLFMELTEKTKLPVKIQSKAPALAVYHQTCCLEYFQEEISLLSDSTFKYTYNNNSYKERQTGKWKMVKDTLILYDYSALLKTTKSLVGEESFDPALKDSISISFKSLKNERILPRISVNGRCIKFWQHRGSSYVIPNKNIKSIEVRDGKYLIKDPNANTIIINYEPDWAAVAREWRVNNISRCILKDGIITRLDCDNSLDITFRLPQKR
jgi:hypothetical protein